MIVVFPCSLNSHLRTICQHLHLPVNIGVYCAAELCLGSLLQRRDTLSFQEAANTLRVVVCDILNLL